jgi:hypothetical protein
MFDKLATDAVGRRNRGRTHQERLIRDSCARAGHYKAEPGSHNAAIMSGGDK